MSDFSIIPQDLSISQKALSVIHSEPHLTDMPEKWSSMMLRTPYLMDSKAGHYNIVAHHANLFQPCTAMEKYEIAASLCSPAQVHITTPT